MQQVVMQLAVLVTASAEGDALGRELVTRGVSMVGSTGSLSQLRRSLVRGSIRSPIVLCVTLDAPTHRRHGESLLGMLDDRCSFPTPLHAIGLVLDEAPAIGWQSIGCDAIAFSQSALEDMLDAFDQRLMAEGSRFSFASTERLLKKGSKKDPSRAETRCSELRWPGSSSPA